MVLPLQRSLTPRMTAGFGGPSGTGDSKEATAGHEAGQGAHSQVTVGS